MSKPFDYILRECPTCGFITLRLYRDGHYKCTLMSCNRVSEGFPYNTPKHKSIRVRASSNPKTEASEWVKKKLKEAEVNNDI